MTIIARPPAATNPGLGPVFPGSIIAENGRIERFQYDQAKVAKCIGLKRRKTKSAEFQADEIRPTRARNKYCATITKAPTQST